MLIKEIKCITDDKELYIQSRRNIYSEWGTHLKFDDYLELENSLILTLKNNGLEYKIFAVVDSNVVCGSCDVFLRPLYLGHGRHTTDYFISKVYVRPEYRRKGLAQKLLNKIIDEYHFGDNQISLWSDIGDYYTKFGFLFPRLVASEPNWSKSLVCNPAENVPNCTNLTMAQIKLQIVSEHQRLLVKLNDTLHYECDERIKFSHIVPHVSFYERFYVRSLICAEKMQLPAPNIFGARTNDGHGWVTWTYMLDEQKLLVLGAFGSANEIGVCMVAACRAAVEYGCKVEMYESSVITLDLDIDEIASAISANGIEVDSVVRKTSLPMSRGNSVWVRPGGYAWG